MKKILVLVFVLMGQFGCSSMDKSAKKELTEIEKAQFHMDMANGALKDGDSTEALKQALFAEKILPLSPEVHHTKGIAFFLKRDFSSSIEALKKALELKPDYAIARNTLGRFLMEAGRTDEAIIELIKSSNDPLNPEAYKASTNLGILYYRRKDYQNAEKNFTEASLQSPNLSCVAHYYLGHLSLKKNSPETAIGQYRKATKGVCGGNFQDAHLAVGLTYEKMKEFDKARKKFLEIQELYPASEAANKAIIRLRGLP